MSLPTGPYLDWEKEVVELDNKIQDLAKNQDFSSSEILSLHKKRDERLEKNYRKLTAWNRVELARRVGRPTAIDYINKLFTDFVELHGDRKYADDSAIVGGFAKLNGQSVVVIGQERGKDTKERIHRNFGSPHPEGYRKALRLMKLAEKFKRPVITIIDTQGAYPGLGAEERGQAEAIAVNLREMAILKVPIMTAVVGEGASGGALGIGVGDYSFMLENAWYTVISPEGCAAILWGDRAKAQDMASRLKLTATDLIELGVIDEEIEEPIGGAHWDPEYVYSKLKLRLEEKMAELLSLNAHELVEKRIEKYSEMGKFTEK